MKYPLTPIRMAIIIKSTNKCWRGCKEKGSLLYCRQKRKLVQLLWTAVWRFPKKLKIELPYDPAIPLLGIYPNKIIVWKDTCTPMFTAALVTIAKTWKQPQCLSAEEWIEITCIYVYIKYYSAMKKKKIMSFFHSTICSPHYSQSKLPKTQEWSYHIFKIFRIVFKINSNFYSTVYLRWARLFSPLSPLITHHPSNLEPSSPWPHTHTHRIQSY